MVFGSDGNDQLDGFAGSNTLSYANFTGDINFGDFSTTTITNPDAATSNTIQTLTLDTALVSKDGFDNLDGITNFNTIIGSNGISTIDGSLNAPLDNTFNVDLSTGTLEVTVGSDVRSFSVIGFDNVIGTRNNDTITGDGLANTIGGSFGSDTIDGGAGNDTLDFTQLQDISSGSVVTLKAAGEITATLGTTTLGTTKYNNIETIVASTSANANVISGETEDPNTAALDVDLENNELTVNFVGQPGVGPFEFDVVGFDNFIGTENDDSFVGDSGNNSIKATLGDDTISGGSGGTDILTYAGFGGAITLGGSGFIAKGDVVNNNGSLGNDLLLGTGSILNPPILNSIDSIIGDSGTDIINTIDGSLNADGNASFVIDLSGTTQTLTVNVSTPGVGAFNFGLQNFTNVVGTANNDSIIANNANNTIFGSAGNDVIDGGAGNDVLDYSNLQGSVTLGGSGLIAKGVVDLTEENGVGSLGNDQLVGETTSPFLNTIETIIGDVGEGIVNTISGVLNVDPSDDNGSFDIDLREDSLIINISTPQGAPAIGPFEFDVFNFSDVIGTLNEDVIKGSDSNNVLTGRAGDDFVFGRKGDDEIDGGEGNDTLRGDTGKDTVSGGIGNDQIDGGGNEDILNGDTGSDFITGKGGADLIDGGLGNDTLLGNAGNDTINGSRGDDRINGGGRFDTLDYTDLGGSVSLKTQGSIAKTDAMGASLGTDTLVGDGDGTAADPFRNSIEAIIGDVGEGIVNTIDGTAFNSSDPRASFDIDLTQDSLVINFTEGDPEFPASGSPNLATQTYVVENFDNVIGTENADSIIGNANDNVFFGSEGNDTLNGVTGEGDTINYTGLGEASTVLPAGLTENAKIDKGELGIDDIIEIDTIIADAVVGNLIDGSNEENAQFEVDLGEDELTIVLTDVPTFVPNPLEFTITNFDQVRGTANADFITGSTANNTIFGSGGSDTINGDGGVNTLDYSGLDVGIVLGSKGTVEKTGLGTDSILGFNATTTAAAGTIIGSETQTNTISGKLNVEPTMANGSFDIDLSTGSLIVNISDGMGGTAPFSPIAFNVVNFDDVVGTQNNDSIVGSTENNKFTGSAGNDSYDGLGGDDTITYEGLGESITLQDTGTIVKGGSLGTDSIDRIETITADSNATNNTIDGEDNLGVSFTVDLEAKSLGINIGTSVVINRTIINFDDVKGTAGNDSITGDDQANQLSGLSGNDELNGGIGNDTLTGGVGNDTLTGGAGDDIINGVGADFGEFDFDDLTGGANADTFILGTTGQVFYEGIGFAEILDFESGVDKIQLAGEFTDYEFDLNVAGGFDISVNTIDDGLDLIAITNSTLSVDDITFV